MFYFLFSTNINQTYSCAKMHTLCSIRFQSTSNEFSARSQARGRMQHRDTSSPKDTEMKTPRGSITRYRACRRDRRKRLCVDDKRMMRLVWLIPTRASPQALSELHPLRLLKSKTGSAENSNSFSTVCSSFSSWGSLTKISIMISRVRYAREKTDSERFWLGLQTARPGIMSLGGARHRNDLIISRREVISTGNR